MTDSGASSEIDRRASSKADSKADNDSNGDGHRLIKLTDATRLIGVTAQTLRDWIRDGLLPARRLRGRRTLFVTRADLERALEPVTPLEIVTPAEEVRDYLNAKRDLDKRWRRGKFARAGKKKQKAREKGKGKGGKDGLA